MSFKVTSSNITFMESLNPFQATCAEQVLEKPHNLLSATHRFTVTGPSVASKISLSVICSGFLLNLKPPTAPLDDTTKLALLSPWNIFARNVGEVFVALVISLIMTYWSLGCLAR